MAELLEPKRPLRLPPDCSIASIRGIYNLLREAFSRQGTLQIDCSDVAKADVTSIQVLLSTARTGQAQGRQVILTALSQSLRNTLSRAGFSGDSLVDYRFNDKQGKG